MVRINLIKPWYLTDQHLIAEYNEILMLLGYVKKYPVLEHEKIPFEYKLGKGHILFFKNKLKYIKKRFNKIKKEMRKRGFKPLKKIKLSDFNKNLLNDWKPNKKDKDLIKKRLREKIVLKPDFYNYYKEKKPRNFYEDLLEKAK